MRKALIRNSDGLLLSHGYFEIQPQPGQSLIEAGEDFPFVCGAARWNGTAFEAWAPTPSTLQQRLTLDEDERIATKGDAAVAAWLDRTPAQARSWVGDTVQSRMGTGETFPQAITWVIGWMAALLLIVARRALRNGAG